MLQDVLGPRPKIPVFTGQVQPLTPTCQIKMSNGEGQRKDIYYTTWAAVSRGKEDVQPIFSHPPQQTSALGLNREKNLG